MLPTPTTTLLSMSASLIAAVRGAAPPQVRASNARVERLGAEVRSKGWSPAGRGKQQHRAEAARVVVAQKRAVVEHEVDVIVRPAAAAAFGRPCRLPVMPKCMSSVSVPNRNSKYLLRRSTRSIGSPVTVARDRREPASANGSRTRAAAQSGGRRRAARRRAAWFPLRAIRAFDVAGTGRAASHRNSPGPGPFVALPDIA